MSFTARRRRNAHNSTVELCRVGRCELAIMHRPIGDKRRTKSYKISYILKMPCRSLYVYLLSVRGFAITAICVSGDFSEKSVEIEDYR